MWNTLSVQAQPYGLKELEQQFLAYNYRLIAARYEIGRAEAEVVQERLWPNPGFGVSEFNLWANHTSENLPPLIGNYGGKQQISVELEQLVETAGKRKKRIAIKRFEQRMAVYEFEELVRELKKELRQTYYHVSSKKHSQQQLRTIVSLFEQLALQYQRQSQEQNVSLADYRRVQAELLRLRKELLTLDDEMAFSLHTLRLLTQLDDLSLDQLKDWNAFESRIVQVPADLISLALEQNVGLKQQATRVEKAEATLKLEQANRKPDLTLQLGYDRGGNIMQDFVGLGVSLDLPLFNRNKGHIQAARYAVRASHAERSSLQWTLESTIRQQRDQLLRYERMLADWTPEILEEQRIMIDNYRKHLQLKQITLLEFVDFVQAVREAQEASFEIWDTYNNTFEELQYLVGIDF
ncbi:TolC family protein [Sphingobacterium suaedae]|uniref:TolC family protein n=1 Tax=Sphingobacterium suaedae TaxID=1686402 RepID=A0ABW5KEQ3_9SPHI